MENKPRTRPHLLQLSCIDIEKKFFRTYNSFRSKLYECYDNNNIVRPRKAEVVYEYIKHLFWCVTSWAFIGSIIIMCIILFSSKSRTPSRAYRNSPRFRKVIKEGIFFDTVEYHER